MNKRSHKIIWVITLTTVMLAFGVQHYLGYLEIQAKQNEIRSRLELNINSMKKLLETDWRLQREPTRNKVEHVAYFSDTPTLATAETYFAQGLLRFYAQSDSPAAEKSLRHAIELDPQWAWPHDVLGIVLFRSGQQESGLASIEHAMKLDPTWSRPHSDLARLYRLEENWDKALAYANTAIKMDKDNPVPLYNYGVVLDYMGDRVGAQEVYLRVLKLNADLPAPYYNIACGYARNGDVSEAIKHLTIAIRLNPEFQVESQEDPDFDALRNDPKFIAFIDQNRPNE